IEDPFTPRNLDDEADGRHEEQACRKKQDGELFDEIVDAERQGNQIDERDTSGAQEKLHGNDNQRYCECLPELATAVHERKESEHHEAEGELRRLIETIEQCIGMLGIEG